MGFVLVLGMVTLSIAGAAAFFSIYGLAQIFSGSFMPVVIMAGSLEAGKLVAASFIYRFWGKMPKWMVGYLFTAILILMLITSAGIFGFLSAAYQQDVLPMKQKQQQIALLQNEKIELEQLKIERLERKKQIDADIASLPNNYITGRQRLNKTYGPELEQLKKDIALYTTEIRQLTTEIATIKSSTLELESHIGPIVFIAAAFEKDVDDATKWLILLIIFAFDPLAVVLTIGTNMALKDIQVKKLSTDSAPESTDSAPESTDSITSMFETFKTLSNNIEDIDDDTEIPEVSDDTLTVPTNVNNNTIEPENVPPHTTNKQSTPLDVLNETKDGEPTPTVINTEQLITSPKNIPAEKVKQSIIPNRLYKPHMR